MHRPLAPTSPSPPKRGFNLSQFIGKLEQEVIALAKSLASRRRIGGGWVPVNATPHPRLADVDHIIVLMMENRSFDHMLGYLALEGGIPGVDGLRPDMHNDYQGRTYPVHPLTDTTFPGEANPRHDGSSVLEQLADSNGGFARSFAEKTGAPDPGLVMGYYTGQQLPVYDHLARNFTICQRWFSSVPGATWPNRLYSVAGAAAGRPRRPAAVPLLLDEVLRPPSRQGQTQLALVLIRPRHPAVHRPQIPAPPRHQLRVRRATHTRRGNPGTDPQRGQQPDRRHRKRHAPGRLLDRPELHRPAPVPALQRRSPTRRRNRRPRTRAEHLPCPRDQPGGMGQEHARHRLRRARRPLRPRAPARGARRRREVSPLRRTSTSDRCLTLERGRLRLRPALRSHLPDEDDPAPIRRKGREDTHHGPPCH